MTHSPDLQKFITYHRDNPQVFEHFEKFTRAALARGHQRLSAWLIMNRVRWETTIETVAADGFKISNGLFAYYSRLYMHRHPSHIGFFCTKEMANETEITAWLTWLHREEENNQAKASPQIDGDPFQQVTEFQQHMLDVDQQKRLDQVDADKAKGE